MLKIKLKSALLLALFFSNSLFAANSGTKMLSHFIPTGKMIPDMSPEEFRSLLKLLIGDTAQFHNLAQLSKATMNSRKINLDLEASFQELIYLGRIGESSPMQEVLNTVKAQMREQLGGILGRNETRILEILTFQTAKYPRSINELLDLIMSDPGLSYDFLVKTVQLCVKKGISEADQYFRAANLLLESMRRYTVSAVFNFFNIDDLLLAFKAIPPHTRVSEPRYFQAIIADLHRFNESITQKLMNTVFRSADEFAYIKKTSDVFKKVHFEVVLNSAVEKFLADNPSTAESIIFFNGFYKIAQNYGNASMLMVQDFSERILDFMITKEFDFMEKDAIKGFALTAYQGNADQYLEQSITKLLRGYSPSETSTFNLLTFAIEVEEKMSLALGSGMPLTIQNGKLHMIDYLEEVIDSIFLQKGDITMATRGKALFYLGSRGKILPQEALIYLSANNLMILVDDPQFIKVFGSALDSAN